MTDINKALSMFSSCSIAEQLKEIMDGLPQELSDQLNVAHDRYQHLIGITSGYFSQEKVKKDQDANPHLIETGDSGLPIFDNEKCFFLLFKRNYLYPLI